MINIDTMRAGLLQGEFFLEYMPTISLADGRCTGAEALIRWRRASGVILPDDFIPIAENTPLSGLITYWVIETVATEIGDWLRANSDARISINVPPEILGRGGLQYAADKSGLIELAPQLILEVTERGVPDLIGLNAINLACGIGCHIALDDVALTGGANLTMLARSHISIIKLDRSLVAQITPECSYPEWLGGITAMLGSSGMEVIAEGVETEQQALALLKANIQMAQGFFFSRSIPATDFIAYHRDAPHSWSTQSMPLTGEK
jgi:sensor c-di-GMP phosphodiesterase-like protein